MLRFVDTIIALIFHLVPTIHFVYLLIDVVWQIKTTLTYRLRTMFYQIKIIWIYLQDLMGWLRLRMIVI